jgi:hypothetical protein
VGHHGGHHVPEGQVHVAPRLDAHLDVLAHQGFRVLPPQVIQLRLPASTGSEE